MRTSTICKNTCNKGASIPKKLCCVQSTKLFEVQLHNAPTNYLGPGGSFLSVL